MDKVTYMFDVKTLEWVINVSPESLRARAGSEVNPPPRINLSRHRVGKGLDFPEILAGTAQLLAPGSEWLTSRLLQHRIADIASFPAMSKQDVSCSEEKVGSVVRRSLLSAFSGAKCPAERQ